MKMTFNGKQIKGVLLDITGVLVESSSVEDVNLAIPGSIEAVKKLQTAGIEVRFVTNETQRTRDGLVKKLHKNGYSMKPEEVFPPALAMASIIKSEKLNPFYLVHPNCRPDLPEESQNDDHTSVLLGDAVDDFNYKNINKAFRILMASNGPLYTLGKGKFYREDGELTLDVGPFAAALEFATDRQSIIVGKPAKEFFDAALNDMKISPAEAVMVGDDIVSDVGGAQKCGMQGVLVRTGKFRNSDENHPDVKPDLIADNLEHFVRILLG